MVMTNLRINKNKIFVCMVIIAFFLTAFRIWLAVRTPLFLQADAAYDDFLLVKYAMSMLQGNWLGIYDLVTLAKTVSFSLLLALGYVCGIPYSFGLVVSYALAVMLLILAVNKFIQNRYFGIILYLFLLFSPVMFHEENVQKVYRGGYIVVFSMLVMAAYIGIFYEARKQENIKIVLWTVLGAIALPVFWFLKEDSIWLAPFLALLILYSVVVIINTKTLNIKKKIVRIVLTVIPILSLIVCSNIYKQLNYNYYGVYTITDRSGSNYEKVISDLLRIEDSSIDQIWITREMLNKAADCSPTLNGIMPQLTERINGRYGDGGDAKGDFIIWIFREAVSSAGIYAQGSEAVEDFYGRINMELQEAFANGSLTENNDRIYLSSVSRGYTPGEFWNYFKGRIREVLGMMVSYKYNMTTVSNARGEYADIAIMSRLTNSDFTWKDTENYLDKMSADVVNMDLKIVKFYQVSGKSICGLGAIGILLLILHTFMTIKKKTYEHLELTLIVIAFAATCAALIIGVIWFGDFLGIKKIYDYLCGAFPIMNLVEAIGVYELINCFIKLLRKKRVALQHRNS